MASAYVRVYFNDLHIRTFGGNKSDVRRMQQKYEEMPLQDLYVQHPKATSHIKPSAKSNRIRTEYVMN